MYSRLGVKFDKQAYDKQWQAANRPTRRRSCQAWRYRNLDAQRARERAVRKRRYQKHRAEILAQNRQWAAANKGKIQARDLRRKIRKLNAPLGDQAVIAAWMAGIRKLPFARCHWCGTKVRGRKVHFDHILALAKGGAHSIENLCASCQECNCAKQGAAKLSFRYEV